MSDGEWTDEDVAHVEEKLAEAQAAGDELQIELRSKLLRMMARDYAARQQERTYVS